MDRSEAAKLLRREMNVYAGHPRTELARLIGQTDAYAVQGPHNVSYQVEVNAYWDDEAGGTIRVIGSIDDGGFRSSLSPLTDGFLMSADGSVDMPDPEAPA
jgi:hypothetical protein